MPKVNKSFSVQELEKLVKKQRPRADNPKAKPILQSNKITFYIKVLLQLQCADLN